MDRFRLRSLKEKMTEELQGSFVKLVSLFTDVDELIVAKIFCQNRGNL